ncbi:MAG: molybdopterin-dependent oxidoreductase [Gemmataceae bacterium]|nr:molybdopterin-dependent oxidoreductase [Gemmataceae bacterium]
MDNARSGRWLAILVVLCAGVSAAAPGDDPRPAAVEVGGLVPKPLKLTADELARMPHQTVREKDHDGKPTEYSGVPLKAILEATGLELGQDLRGPALEHYLMVEAADGYRVLFALPELDSLFTDRVVVLADRRDGKPLSAKEGPFQVIVPGEKRHGRWVRQVTGLKIKRG